MTDNERAVLSHVVIDPDAWWANAQEMHTQKASAFLAAKIARWQASYNAVKDHPNYLPRVLRPEQTSADLYVPAAE